MLGPDRAQGAAPSLTVTARCGSSASRCLSHRPIRVGVVGGSISAGQGVYPSSGPPEFLGSYSRLFYDWLDAACPHKQNACVPCSTLRSPRPRRAARRAAPRSRRHTMSDVDRHRAFGVRHARARRHGFEFAPSLRRRYINGARRATGSVHFSQCLWRVGNPTVPPPRDRKSVV